MDEAEHIISVLKECEISLKNENVIKLRELSNSTIHSASIVQDAGSITLAVLIYSFSKIIERNDYKKMKNWDKFKKKIIGLLNLSVLALEQKKVDKYENYLKEAQMSMYGMVGNMKPYIREVLRKASINKASKIYEHGISMGKTSELLGITQWELSEYAGQKHLYQKPFSSSSVKKRAEMALEFFS
ncbi:MAG: hypothetical protein AABW65_02375 [Nanoarchaeota archaeon]